MKDGKFCDQKIPAIPAFPTILPGINEKVTSKEISLKMDLKFEEKKIPSTANDSEFTKRKIHSTANESKIKEENISANGNENEDKIDEVNKYSSTKNNEEQHNRCHQHATRIQLLKNERARIKR